MTRKIAVDIVVFSYILLFVYAALTKLLDYQKFVVQLGQSPILTNYAQVLAVVIPFIELGISLMLIFPKTRLKGLYAAFGLMVMFTTYIVLASRFSDYVPCSCGGVLEGMTWTQHLIFNTVFVLLALIGILLQPNISSVDSSTSLS
ncbi:MAG: DoxX family membrane protein [Cyclobacteriaceae bacterium]|nr:DoxX family membrane protein [Cyclobacteriaceae bacterium]